MTTIKEQLETLDKNTGPDRMQEFIDNGDKILHTVSFEVLTTTNQTPTPEVSAGFIELCMELQKHGHSFHFMANCDLDVLAKALKPLENYLATANSGQVRAYNGKVTHCELKGVGTQAMIKDLAGLQKAFPTVEIYPRGDGVCVRGGLHHGGITTDITYQLQTRCDELNAKEGQHMWVLDTFSAWNWLHVNRTNAPDPDLRQPPKTFRHAALDDKTDVDSMPIDVYLKYRMYQAFISIAKDHQSRGYKLAYVGGPDNTWGISEYVAQQNGYSVVVMWHVGPLPPHASKRDDAAQSVKGTTGLNQYFTELITRHRINARKGA